MVSDEASESQLLGQVQTLFEDVLERALGGYWEWHIQEDTERLSPAFMRMLGYEDPKLPNRPKSWKELIFEEDLAETLSLIGEHVRTHGQVPWRNEIRYRHRDGSAVWTICIGRVVDWDARGNPLRLVGCHVDITERKRAQAERRGAAAFRHAAGA